MRIKHYALRMVVRIKQFVLLWQLVQKIVAAGHLPVMGAHAELFRRPSLLQPVPKGLRLKLENKVQGRLEERQWRTFMEPD